MRAARFQDLEAYQLAYELQQEIFRISKAFPHEERYSLTNQVRRSSRSIGANIAEAWRKRTYPAHFVSKLTDADAENSETQHWVQTACDCGYIEREVRDSLMSTLDVVGAKLGRMMSTAESWKPHD